MDKLMVTAERRGGERAAWRRRGIVFVVGLVLADVAIVVLALPAIYREFAAEVGDVAWVVTSFNLALALTAIPAAVLVTRVGAERLFTTGCLTFAGASLTCGLAPTLGVLLVARSVQGVAGALVICAALALMASDADASHASRTWSAAGIAGAAIGPAAGGALTQLVSWQSIFIVQVPLALIPLVLLGRSRAKRETAPAPGPIHVAANAALGLSSAGLMAALFLLVLLLVEGWRMSPITAAAVVTVLAGATLLAGPLERRLGSARTRAAAGALAGAGGLAALGVLPGAHWGWTLPAQLLVGAGLTLSLGGLTEAALRGRPDHPIHGGVTIASRHVGIVVGLLVLTPVFVADLTRLGERVELTSVATIIDAELRPGTKLRLAQTLAASRAVDTGRLPDIAGSFAGVSIANAERPAVNALADQLDQQIDRSASDAFVRSFLVAAVLTLLGLIPLALGRDER